MTAAGGSVSPLNQVCLGVLLVGAISLAGCASAAPAPSAKPAVPTPEDHGKVTYHDDNSDGFVDFEMHDFGCCDRNWALVDSDFDGSFDLRVQWGYSVTETPLEQPVPHFVPVSPNSSGWARPGYPGMGSFMAVAALALAMPAHGENDRCSGLLPGDLARALEQANPDYRLPKETDSLQEDVEYRLSEKGSACLGMATADFDGNGHPDYLVAMPARSSDATLITVALRKGAHWKLDALDMWPSSKLRVFVAIEPAGRYERTQALEGPASESDEVLSMRCSNPVAVVGFTESSAVAYCRQADRWQHVWISD